MRFPDENCSIDRTETEERVDSYRLEIERLRRKLAMAELRVRELSRELSEAQARDRARIAIRRTETPQFGAQSVVSGSSEVLRNCAQQSGSQRPCQKPCQEWEY